MKKTYIFLGLLLMSSIVFSKNPLVLNDSIFNGGHMYNATAGDFDNDGDNDFIASDWAGAWRLFINDGNAHFTPTDLTDFEHNGSVVVGDINGDKIPDVIISANDPHTMEVWLCNGDGSFTKSTTHGIANGSGEIRTLQLFDADGDGDLDLLLSNGSEYGNINAYSELWLNDGTGVFTLKTTIHQRRLSSKCSYWRY